MFVETLRALNVVVHISDQQGPSPTFSQPNHQNQGVDTDLSPCHLASPTVHGVASGSESQSPSIWNVPQSSLDVVEARPVIRKSVPQGRSD